MLDEILNPAEEPRGGIWLEQSYTPNGVFESYLTRVAQLHEAYQIDPSHESQARLSDEAVQGALELYKELELRSEIRLEDFLSKKGATLCSISKDPNSSTSRYTLPKEYATDIYTQVSNRISDPSVDISLTPQGMLQVTEWHK